MILLPNKWLKKIGKVLSAFFQSQFVVNRKNFDGDFLLPKKNYPEISPFGEGLRVGPSAGGVFLTEG